MSKIFEQLLQIRNFDHSFLKPSYEDCSNPYQLYSMDKAIERIRIALNQTENILIFGDYDADGITASTLMRDALKLAGVKNIFIMLPDRFKDGYGMNEKIFDFAKKHHCSLIITVDCGSRNHETIKKLKEQGIDTIVTDHHECEDALPDAIAVINPKRKDHPAPQELQDLAGVGVAFMVAKALEKEHLIPSGQEKWLLDLVLIGTLCDSMKMCGENRRLCYWGMKVIPKTRRIGLKELMNTANIHKIDSSSIGFQLGPRINASGRMATPETALNLFNTDSPSQAALLASELEELNRERKDKQRAAVAEINNKGVGDTPVIVVTGDWHEGVLGIIAGRLVDEYHKPAFVLAKQGDAWKGSGRSFGDFSLAEALSACKDSIISGGGHAGACGVRVADDQLNNFRLKLNDYYKSLQLPDQSHFYEQQADLEVVDFSDITPDLVNQIAELEPFGPSNPEPVFLLKEVEILDVRKMGTEEQHLRLDVSDHRGNTLKLLAFFAPKEWLNFSVGETVNVLVNFTDNEWQNRHTVEGRILKITN